MSDYGTMKIADEGTGGTSPLKCVFDASSRYLREFEVQTLDGRHRCQEESETETSMDDTDYIIGSCDHGQLFSLLSFSH